MLYFSSIAFSELDYKYLSVLGFYNGLVKLLLEIKLYFVAEYYGSISKASCQSEYCILVGTLSMN